MLLSPLGQFARRYYETAESHKKVVERVEHLERLERVEHLERLEHWEHSNEG